MTTKIPEKAVDYFDAESYKKIVEKWNQIKNTDQADAFISGLKKKLESSEERTDKAETTTKKFTGNAGPSSISNYSEVAGNINSISELVDSLNKDMAPNYKAGKYRNIDDTGSFSADLYPAPRLTHKCYCSHCGTDNYIDWLEYPNERYSKLGCIKCRTRINTGEAYKFKTNNQIKEMPIE